jgi:hypothetical protein
MGDRVTMDPELRAFIRQSVPSVLALEVLLFLRVRPAESWTSHALAAALRNNACSCEAIMAAFAGRGLLVRRGTDYAYAPETPALELMAERLERAYRERRVAVINAIVRKGA